MSPHPAPSAEPVAGPPPAADHEPDAAPETGTDAAGEQSSGFMVSLDNFSGPFDLLLQLISRHKMDITEVALSKVTDEFIAHIKAAGEAWDLEQTSQFVVVAATLLDLKAARLLPSGEVDDPEDLALLEARDLLFARLLQYRAFKQVAAWMGELWLSQGRRFARPGGLEPFFARLQPDVTISVPVERFAAIAARAMLPKEPDEVSLAHLHAPQVSVRDQAEVVVERLRRAGSLTFRALTGDSPDRVTTVCRFLALLELFRSAVIAFEQLTPLGELTVRWTGGEDDRVQISDEFDHPARPGEDADDTDDAGQAEPGGDPRDEASPQGGAADQAGEPPHADDEGEHDR